MERKRIARWAPLGCFVLSALVLSSASQAAKKEVLTISGKIEGAEMRKGKIVSVFIADAEHGEFIVLRGTDVSKRLVGEVGRTIRAKGYVGDALRDKGFDRYIDILEYELLADESDGDGP